MIAEANQGLPILVLDLVCERNAVAAAVEISLQKRFSMTPKYLRACTSIRCLDFGLSC